MDMREAIKKMVSKSGETLKSVSIKSGRSAAALSNSVNTCTGDIGAGALSSYAQPCGYILALVPQGQVPADALVIDPREPDKARVAIGKAAKSR